MNGAHVHLLVNHIPILGGIFAFLLLAITGGFRNPTLARFALLLFFLFAISAVAVNFTGDGAEEVVEQLPGISEDRIEAHEEAATLAVSVFALAGLIALGGLIAFRSRPRLPAWYLALMLVVGLANSVLIARTGLLGGEIRHSEILDEAPAESPPGS